MNKKTIQKLICLMKKDIEKLLLDKADMENQLKSLENEFMHLKHSFNEELQLIIREGICTFDSGTFIEYQLLKQSEKQKEITGANDKLQSLVAQVVEANITMKTYEHLLEQIIEQARAAENKNETLMIDELALYKSRYEI